jgi:hypothetical protein
MNEHRGRVASAVSLLAVCLLGVSSPVRAQTPLLDQILVTVLRDRVFAVTPVEGIMRVDLLAGEEVVAVSSVGLNALVQTSMRLLGFSSQVMRWSELRTDLSERVLDRRVLPRLIVVRTDKHLYGFQGQLGRWKMEDLGLREEVRETLADENVAVVITDRRALAFSAFTGGFFQQELSADDPVLSSALNDNAVVLATGTRRWIFRSQLAIWAELR